MNPLFPAIVEKHLTLGAGYAINQASSVDVSLTNGFEANVVEKGLDVSHSQLNWQMMYSHRF